MKNNTKEEITIEALKLFAVRGYEAVSMREIADELGITKAALYKHFESKHDILQSIVMRMEKEDSIIAEACDVPSGTLSDEPDSYRQTTFEDLMKFTKMQFSYWTEDPFASRFRKMLALEKNRDAEMAKLFEQYVCSGPLGYVADIFSMQCPDCYDAQQKALEFYGPVFMLYSLYDGSGDEDGVRKMLRNHLEKNRRGSI